MDYDEAGALADELDDAGLVRVGGGHSVGLTEAGGGCSKPPPRPVGLKLERAGLFGGREKP